MKFKNYPIKSSKKTDITVVVNSCDNYDDVRSLFKKCFEEFWPQCPFEVIYNYESNPLLNYSVNDRKSINWGERLIDILNKVNTEYVLLLFDDFLLEDYVKTEKINQVFSVLESDKNAVVFYLNAACVSDHEDTIEKDFRRLKDNIDYRVNSVPGLWRRKDLINFTDFRDNPWAWEIFGSYRTFGCRKNFYSVSSQSQNIYQYAYSKGGGIYRGKWVRDVVEEKIKKYSLPLDISVRGTVELNEPIRRSLLWKLKFIYLGYNLIGFRVFKFFRNQFRKKMRHL